MVETDSLLGVYRVLDLTDERGLLCGKILADLGADVIKVEKPDGDKARNIGPFYQSVPEPNKSLLWWAFNTNKRSITLDIETTGGKQVFEQLVKSADIILESFEPGYLTRIGLDYTVLSKVNPKIILTSISSFGQTGPYSKYKDSDLVVWALGGLMSVCGDPDRPPVQVSFPQSYIAASTYAAEGTLVALYGRSASNRGQHVDVSAQATITWLISELIPFWVTLGQNVGRAGQCMTRAGGIKVPTIWRCQDGYISYLIQAGLPGAERNILMAEWLEEEGLATEYIKAKDWYEFDWAKITQEELNKIVEPLSKLFLRHTVDELYTEAVKRVISLYPVSDSKRTLGNPQLAARRFWTKLRHGEIDKEITYPGAFAVFSETPILITHRAPLIGEHNEEIYIEEMGFTKDKLLALKAVGAV